MEIRFNPDDMTIGDLEDFEDLVGKPFDEVVRPAPRMELDPETGEMRRVFDEKGRPQMQVRMSAKAIKALVWILGKKQNPEFTLEDARNVKVTALVLEGDASAEGEDRGNE